MSGSYVATVQYQQLQRGVGECSRGERRGWKVIGGQWHRRPGQARPADSAIIGAAQTLVISRGGL